ncbi:MAG: DUF523 domain-containing protein [Desulfuromonadales bacterium]|nr:DUF523 domain-containing protein [Desulfuromonadales bacterium]
MKTPILVSACLLGIACRYDGRSKQNPAVLAWLAEQELTPIPVCPEQLAGLPTPRLASRFASEDGPAVLNGQADVVTHDGQTQTEAFIRGADQTLAIAHLCGCRTALLKERSPSCGVRQIDRNGAIVPGQGVTTARLQTAGLDVFSEEQLLSHVRGCHGC